MTINVAINGYGRIGRCILRAAYESTAHEDIRIVAINNLRGIDVNVHLTKYDTTHGHFHANVYADGDSHMVVNGDKIHVTTEKDPANLPWRALGIDVVFECTGQFTDRESAAMHLHAGANKVLISAPGKDVDATVVYGVNHQQLSHRHTIASNASCTTNCLAPLAKPLHEKLGIVSGIMNTVHAVTCDQVLLDNSHKDLRRARSAMQSIIPTKTGAAASVGLVLPALAGKLDGFAMRVPTINVSAVDFTFKASRKTSAQEVHDILLQASEHELKDILVVNQEPLVSCDFNHHPASAIYDATQTKVIGDLVKVVAWYDNEWGFSNRMLDVCRAWVEA